MKATGKWALLNSLVCPMTPEGQFLNKQPEKKKKKKQKETWAHGGCSARSPPAGGGIGPPPSTAPLFFKRFRH